MAFYDDMAVIALDMLTEFGVAGTLTRRTPGAYVSGKRGTNTATDTVQVMFKKKSELQPEDALKKRHEVMISVPPVLGAVDVGDTITVAAVAYIVVEPGPIAPGGRVVAYDAVIEV